MGAALLVFGYALAVAWSAPAVLARLTGHGIGARLGLAAWLTAMGCVLACAGAAVALLAGARNQDKTRHDSPSGGASAR